MGELGVSETEMLAWIVQAFDRVQLREFFRRQLGEQLLQITPSQLHDPKHGGLNAGVEGRKRGDDCLAHGARMSFLCCQPPAQTLVVAAGDCPGRYPSTRGGTFGQRLS